MNDWNHEKSEDEGLEISDLPEETFSFRKRPRRRFSPVLVSLISWSRTHRRLSMLGTICLMLVALGVILTTIPLQPPRSDSGEATTPTPTPLSGQDLYYFSPLPLWGTVFLDGQPLSQVPVASGQNDAPLRFSAGRHVLEWQAPPFQPQRCILQVPSLPQAQRNQQECQVSAAPPTQFAKQASQITIPVSLAQLPEQQRTILIQKTQALLNTLQTTQTIQSGERYADPLSPDQIRIASQQLQATLRFYLDTDPTRPATCPALSLGQGCIIRGQDCRLFCTPNWPLSPEDQQRPEWNVAVLFHTTWHYTGHDGQTISSETPQSSARQPDLQMLTLRISWNHGQWQVAFQNPGTSSFDDPLCVTTIRMVGANPRYWHAPGKNASLSWGYASGPAAGDGCVAVAQTQSPTADQIVEALLLRRFGVLLAANEVAHQLWPSLPLANADEQRFATEQSQRVQW